MHLYEEHREFSRRRQAIQVAVPISGRDDGDHRVRLPAGVLQGPPSGCDQNTVSSTRRRVCETLKPVYPCRRTRSIPGEPHPRRELYCCYVPKNCLPELSTRCVSPQAASIVRSGVLKYFPPVCRPERLRQFLPPKEHETQQKKIESKKKSLQ